MGLLEKAGNVQTEEKKSTKVAKATKVVKAEKEAEKFNQAVAKAAKKAEPSPKEPKKAAKKAAKKAKPKKVKTPRAKKERILKQFPEGFDEVNKARSWFRKLIDFSVNFAALIFYIPMNTQFGGSANFTPILILSLILPAFNLIFMPLKTGRSVGQWVTTTRYVNSRGKYPSFFYHLLKSSWFVSYLSGLAALLFLISAGTEWNNVLIGFIAFMILLFLLVPVDWLFKKFHQQSFGVWEFLFQGVWDARAQKGEGSTGNKLFQRLESLSDYTESKGWLEDKE